MSRKANWRCESDSIEEGDEEKQAREASLWERLISLSEKFRRAGHLSTYGVTHTPFHSLLLLLPATSSSSSSSTSSSISLSFFTSVSAQARSLTDSTPDLKRTLFNTRYRAKKSRSQVGTVISMPLCKIYAKARNVFKSALITPFVESFECKRIRFDRVRVAEREKSGQDTAGRR